MFLFVYGSYGSQAFSVSCIGLNKLIKTSPTLIQAKSSVPLLLVFRPNFLLCPPMYIITSILGITIHIAWDIYEYIYQKFTIKIKRLIYISNIL